MNAANKKSAEALLDDIVKLIEADSEKSGKIRSVAVIASGETGDVSLLKVDGRELPYFIGLMEIVKSTVVSEGADATTHRKQNVSTEDIEDMLKQAEAVMESSFGDHKKH